jgi:uncharacterized protein
MTRALSRRRVLLGIGLVGPLGACADTPPPKLFTLAARSAAPIAGPSRSVMVGTVGLPKYLDRPQIVRLANDYQLSVSDYERWAEGMGDMVTRVLVENLSLRLPSSRIYAASGTLAPPADVVIKVEIGSFAADSEAGVVLSANFVMQAAAGEARYQSERIEVRAASANALDVVAGMSEALGQLSDRIARALAIFEV